MPSLRRRHPPATEFRYVPGDTPYPYKDCRKALRQLGVTAQEHRLADSEERLGAQVDLLRMALETIAAGWVDADGGGPTIPTLAGQRESDQKLARQSLMLARSLDDDRTKQRAAGGRVGKR